MKVSYYLNEERKKNLYCRISDGTERITFSLEQCINPKQWDPRKEIIKDNEIQTSTLSNFKQYLKNRYHVLNTEIKENILDILKREATAFLDGTGIEGLSKNMFDHFNHGSGIPKYEEFIKAFEKYSQLTRDEFKIQTLGSEIAFYTKGEDFVLHTYEGRIKDLKFIIENKRYEEILTETNEAIWSLIYVDAGIEKNVFLPKLLSYWEAYWREIYKEIEAKVGNTQHLDEMKAQSWRQFQTYMECYDSDGDAITLAYRIDIMALYPLSVVTMMNIFDADTCYNEYCEQEFYGTDEWESITLDDESEDSPVFYVKPYEL